MTHSVALNFADGKTFFISVQNNELLLNAAIRQWYYITFRLS